MHGMLGRDPTLAEMAKKMHWTARQVRGVLDAAEAAKGIGSLENPIDSDDDNIRMEDMIAETSAQSPENLISVLKLHDELQQALTEIGDRERVILELRHGLTGQSPMTLEEVGKRLKLSRERIRQIEKIALNKLRRTVVNTKLNIINEVANKVIEQNGGVMLEDALVLETLTAIVKSKGNGDAHIIRLALNINQDLEKVDKSQNNEKYWYDKGINVKVLKNISNLAVKLLKKSGDIVRKEKFLICSPCKGERLLVE